MRLLEKNGTSSLSDLGALKAKIGPSEDSFCHIRRSIARLWDKKAVNIGPLRPICSPTLPKSDRLLVSGRGKKQRATGAGFRAMMSLPVKAFSVATQSVNGLA